jgi:translation initiation factor IF-3
MRIHRHRHRKAKFSIPHFNVNEKITATELRVVHEGKSDVMSRDAALELAQEAGLDLIEISPKAQPPVCKIMDFGSFKYQKEKEAKQQRAASKEVEIKGIRLSFRIGENDIAVRRKQALKFLSKGHKVRIEMILRGREKAHRGRAAEIIKTFASSLKEEYDIRIEGDMKTVGNRMQTIVARVS